LSRGEDEGAKQRMQDVVNDLHPGTFVKHQENAVVTIGPHRVRIRLAGAGGASVDVYKVVDTPEELSAYLRSLEGPKP